MFCPATRLPQGLNQAQPGYGLSILATNCPKCGGLRFCPQIATGQQQALGINVITMNCPNCNTPVTRDPGTPWQNVQCPNCGNTMLCPQGATGQAQAWPLPANRDQDNQPVKDTVQREEYLECPNCRIQIKPTPGIPWAGATCPSCKTVMAHFIREVQTKNNGNAAGQQQPQSQAQQQMWDPFPAAHKKFDQGVNNLFGLQPQALQQAPAPQITQQTTGGLGAGIIVSSQGYVLTNYHLIAGQTDITITLFTPNGNQAFPGIIIATDPANDLAILQINSRLNDTVGQATTPIELPVAPLGNSDNSTIGDTVLAFGNPFGLAQTVTDGIISAKRNNVNIEGHQLASLIQTDAPINQGNSGGPLVNINGEVIGINTAIYSPMQTHTGLGFAVPINLAKQAFAKYLDLKSPEAVKAQLVAMRWLPCPMLSTVAQTPLNNTLQPNTVGPAVATPNVIPPGTVPSIQNPIRNNPVSNAWMGMEFQLLNAVMAEQIKVPFDQGILVSNVFLNSPAAAGGLKSGDVIYRANGKRITTETQLSTLLANIKTGDVVTFSIFRTGKKMDVNIASAN